MGQKQQHICLCVTLKTRKVRVLLLIIKKIKVSNLAKQSATSHDDVHMKGVNSQRQ